MRLFNKRNYVLICVILSLVACKNNEKGNETEEVNIVAQTPVTVTTVSNEPLKEYIELNATSAFLQKSFVKANTPGYLKLVNTQLGKFVSTGDLLFLIKTKEAQSIGNTITQLDPSFKFSGENSIKAPGTGYITQLNHQEGDYVQDGEQLAVISDINSFAFVLELPYELRGYVLNQKKVELALPDKTIITGIIEDAMPTVDLASQTQNIIIRVPGNVHIPENLIARVSILKTEKSCISVPKAAILSNDVQTEFWVMKMMDSTTAIKVAVKKGIETKDRVEVLSPVFSLTDKVLITGNFGLPDTAGVKIMEP